MCVVYRISIVLGHHSREHISTHPFLYQPLIPFLYIPSTLVPAHPIPLHSNHFSTGSSHSFTFIHSRTGSSILLHSVQFSTGSFHPLYIPSILVLAHPIRLHSFHPFLYPLILFLYIPSTKVYTSSYHFTFHLFYSSIDSFPYFNIPSILQ